MNNAFLTKKWLAKQQKRIQLHADKRYMPNLHIELDIEVAFDSLTRNKEFYTRFREFNGKFLKRANRILEAQIDQITEEEFKKVRSNLKTLTGLTSSLREYDTNPIDWESIASLSKNLEELVYKITDNLRLYSEDGKKPESRLLDNRSKYDNEIHELNELNRSLNILSSYETDYHASLTNSPFFLLKGDAGSGKTHLLCEIASKRTIQGLPTIFFFGDEFINSNSIWDVILGNLGFVSKDEFLSTLCKKARERRTRALIIIDAINESFNSNLWKTEIENFVNDVKEYQDVAIVFSLRNQFLEEFTTKKMLSVLKSIEHRGFEHKEWEAVSMYFKYFGLRLPEIPLILPEFRNPLFLLILCLGLKDSKKRDKTIIKGHEGSTYIFERYIEHVSEDLANKYNLDSGNTRRADIIWNTIIKEIAKAMSRNRKHSDTVTKDQLTKIITNKYQQLDVRVFINDLEKNFILSRVPRYGRKYKVKEYVYQFPFQRFSDHLIVRYLLKKYLIKKDYKSLLKLFSKAGSLGKIIHQPYNSGLIEAFAVQLPERLDGTELLSLIRGKTYYSHEQAFLNSIVWRKPSAFKLSSKGVPLKTIEFMNKYGKGVSDETLNILISVAAIPEHPLNAKFLHSFLIKQTMAYRDHIWSEFLHRSNEDSSIINNLLTWAWSNVDKSSISSESLELVSLVLSWFLTTPNRFVRDKSTKALVSLLQTNLDLVLKLLKNFEKVNDSYITERLYAIAYGCVLRGKFKKAHLIDLSKYIYEKQFRFNKPSKHILIRDYAKSIVEFTSQQHPELKFNAKLYLPPYHTKFPEKVTDKDVLEKKYMNKHEGRSDYSRIWYSIMGDDFGHYIIDSALHRWTKFRLNQPRQLTKKEQYDKFVNDLSCESKEAWDKLQTKRFSQITLLINEIDGTKEKKLFDATKEKELTDEYIELERSFIETLNESENKVYSDTITIYLNGERSENTNFDNNLARSWIFERSIKLGWNPELHGQFDGIVNYHEYSRDSHKPERIGKKYQWIALYEFLAMVADNFEYSEYFQKETPLYKSPASLYIRNIDPSRLFPEVNKQDNVVNIKPKFKLWGQNIEDNEWIKHDEYLPDITKMIKTDRKHLLLNGYFNYDEDVPPEVEKYDVESKDLWFIVSSYIARKDNIDRLYKWAKKQNFFGKWMPEPHEISDLYLYEYPKMKICEEMGYGDNWVNVYRDSNKIPCDVGLTCTEYHNGGGYDCSGDSNNIYLPSAYLINAMKLSQVEDGIFCNSKGEEVVFDNYVKHGGQNALIANKKRFIKFLKENNLAILWTVLGEKRTVGGERKSVTNKKWSIINTVMSYEESLGWQYTFKTHLD